jgi:EAL domain-containing protein (putative c-di-GMP-specific phosphodiesterase class I)
MDTSSGQGSLEAAIALLDGLERAQLTLEYQVVFESRTRRVRGVEALLRWRHPELGLLLPGDFLPEELSGGVGRAITRFVLTEAIVQAARWRRQGYDIPVSVNVPPACIVEGSIIDLTTELLAEQRLPANRLTVEITENGYGTDLGPLRQPCIALARAGVRLSLDDFGLGDSSLSRLQQIHFDEIKIDRSFVQTAPRSPTDRTIVLFATELAHQLGMSVVAEGVETGAMCALINKLGVDCQQGFYWHRPAPPDEVGQRFENPEQILLD